MRFPVFCARIRVPLCAAAVVVVVVGAFLPGFWMFWLGIGLLVPGLALYFRVGTVRGAPVAVAVPVTGRWFAVNSPASRVPSHGLHVYGQTYAIDLVHAPAEGSRPGFAWWPPARRPEAFPGFGQPVLAPASGRVVRVHSGQRDHWSRNSVLGIVCMLLEGVRELFGPARILGNYVVLDLGDGVHAVLAHLRRGSLRVRAGERVETGQHVADCGNSGNSAEPHVHVQLMDRPSCLVAAGLPFRFADFPGDDGTSASLPPTGTPFVADDGSASR